MKSLTVYLLTYLVVGLIAAQNIRYDISFPNAMHHEAEISLTVKNVKAGPAIFRMSRSSPGRYATHEFGKNIYALTAWDKAGKQLEITRTDADVYEVARHSGFIKVRYTLFGYYADGTYASVDETGAHLNMPATLLWMKGTEKDSSLIEVNFSLPESKNWTIATQLKPAARPNLFTAPGMQYLMDSPVKIGNLQYQQWQLQNPDGKPYSLRLALDAAATEEQAKDFAVKIKNITRQAQVVYGETPVYDYGTYTFLVSINPYVHGDGMEHRNSTMITLPEVFNGSNDELEAFAHEFFHCWNVERIRPKSLEPFNFEKSNMSSELWLAEGFTQYYGDLLMKRCGYYSNEAWFGAVSRYINAKEAVPGGKEYSPIDNSRNAVFVDAGVAVDKTNYPNHFSSYYPYGAAIALALDLTLRDSFNSSLDDFMRLLWKKHGKPEKPYTVADVQKALTELTGSAAFAAGFFNRYIYGHESFDYAAALAKAGFVLKNVNAGKAWLGNAKFTDGLKIAGPTVKNTPLYNAGLDVGDEIISIEGKSIATPDELNAVIAAYQPGKEITLSYKHNGDSKTAKLVLGQSPFFSIAAFESEGKEIDSKVANFRENWWGNKIKE